MRGMHPGRVADVIGVDEQIDATLVSERLLSALATAFAALAVCLPAIGVEGVLRWAVARLLGRTRSSHGAPRRLPCRLGVFLEVLVHVAVGMATGLSVALSASRAAEDLLFGVTPADPANYLFTDVVIAMVACLAACLPAWRAVTEGGQRLGGDAQESRGGIKQPPARNGQEMGKSALSESSVQLSYYWMWWS